jgi:hypothetical protein
MKDLLIGKGQILIEIVITVTLVSVFLIIAYYAFNSNQLLSLKAVNYLQAISLANNEIEKLRDFSRTNFSQIVNTTTTNGNFLIERIVSDIDASTKKVNLKVSWNFGQPQSLILTSYFVDWKNIAADDGSGGANGGGGTGLSGNWANPRILASVDFGLGVQGTDVNVKNNTVFVSAVSSNNAKPDLFIVDVSDPSNPSIKSSINTGPGVNSLAVKGNYAYLANNNNQNQLQIIDISNELAPSLIKQITLPNNNATPLSIFAFKNYVIISTGMSTAGKEVFIYDVNNPLSPSLVSSINIDKNVNDIFVYNNRLYLSAVDSFYIYDISNIASPVLLSNFMMLARTSDFSMSLFPVSNDLLLVGGALRLFFIDTSNLDSIRVISSIAVSNNKISDIYARENLAFLATSNANREFQIVNYGNINSPSLYAYLNFPQEATGIDYRNNLIFVSVRSNDALRIITSQ